MPGNDLIPFIGKHLINRAHLDTLSPEGKLKAFEEYRDYLSLNKGATFDAAAFDKCNESRIKDVQGFENTKVPGNSSIGEKLRASTEEAKFVSKAIDDALKPLPDFTQAQADYKTSAEHFTDLITLIPGKYKAEQLIGYMTRINDDARKEIEAQQKAEKENLIKLFDDGTFKNHLKTSLNLKTDEEINTVKENVLKDLNTAQKKQLDDFDKAASEAKTKLTDAMGQQVREFEYLAMLYKHTKTREKIERLYMLHKEKLNPDPNKPAVLTQANNGSIKISNVSLDQLDVITTITGKEITKNPDGSYTAKFGMRLFNMGYYSDFRQNVLTEHINIAQGVRASGHDTIIMELDYDDPFANETAKLAYEACIESGFPANGITIKIRGVEKKVEEIFKDNISDLQKINAREAVVSSELKKIKIDENIKLPDEKFEEMKKEVQNFKAKKVAKEEEHAEPAADHEGLRME